jgi:uncharacterized protein (DUF608 family)
MLKLLQNLQAGVHAPDHFPFEPGGQVSTYDAFKAAGHTIYNCELFLLTEEIMIDATQKARELGVPQATTAVEQQLKSDLPQAKEEFETLFWDPLDHHYILGPSTYGNGIFMDSLFAQNVATTLGLPTLVDPVREAEHLRTAYPQEMQERLEGHLVGPPNMVPNSGPVVADQNVIEENEVWPGAAMLNAGAYLQAGQQSQDPTLVNEGLEMAHSLEYWITEDQRLGFLFEAPESWKYTKPFEYRSPSMNRTRSALGVLNTIKPIVRWKVAPPSASLYVAP